MSWWLNGWFKNKGVVEATIEVTNSMTADMDPNTIKANNTGSAAAPTDMVINASSFPLRGASGNLANGTFSANGLSLDGTVVTPTTYWDAAAGVFKDAAGVALPSLSAATIAALPAAAAGNSGWSYFVDNPGNNTRVIPCQVRSSGSRWDVVGGDAELYSEVINKEVICPAATFTASAATTAAGDADTLLTSSGVHGLTSAGAVGKYIYISAGSGWTVGLHKITAIAVDTTGVTIQVDTPFSSQSSPTIALAGTELNMLEINVPPLTSTGKCTYDISVDYNGVTTNEKRVRVRHATAASGITTGTSLYSRNESSASPTARFIGGFANFASTAVQEGYTDDGQASGIGTVAGGVAITGAIETNVATVLRINALLGVAGDSIKLIRVTSRFGL